MSKFQKLEDQLQVKANPKSVEATATDTINTLDRLDGSVMSYHHSDWLKNRVEDIRDILRRM